jgi:hypothetical protein
MLLRVSYNQRDILIVCQSELNKPLTRISLQSARM